LVIATVIIAVTGFVCFEWVITIIVTTMVTCFVVCTMPIPPHHWSCQSSWNHPHLPHHTRPHTHSSSHCHSPPPHLSLADVLLVVEAVVASCFYLMMCVDVVVVGEWVPAVVSCSSLRICCCAQSQ
jgi:hypothetical protein